MTAHSDSSAQLGAPGPSESSPASNSQNQTFRAVREIVETLLLAALIFFLVRLVVLNFRVDGQSMTPNLDNEQMLLVNRNAYQFVDWQGNTFYPFDPPERGDIVVFNPPTESDKPYIKRIIGLPGDEVTFSNGQVFVNGHMLEEDYIEDRTRCQRNDYCDVIVPEGEIFVLGDHRSNSSDSRVFGPVPIENVIGKAWLSYWPIDDIGFVPHESYPDIPNPVVEATPSA
ncbi:MAG: signal peptidase I [Chloroflexia bacterium]|nr:signal peptidase I [Chloroflexia bacterium]